MIHHWPPIARQQQKLKGWRARAGEEEEKNFYITITLFVGLFAAFFLGLKLFLLSDQKRK